jgi:hypothetical protein
MTEGDAPGPDPPIQAWITAGQLAVRPTWAGERLEPGIGLRAVDSVGTRRALLGGYSV